MHKIFNNVQNSGTENQKYNSLHAANYGETTWFCILKPKWNDNSG